MLTRHHENLVRVVCEQADIRINGDRPYDIRIYNDSFYRRAISQGSLGLGETYMERWWDAAAVDQLVERLLRVDVERHIRGPLRSAGYWLATRLYNLQSRRRARTSIATHYDLGNDLFEAMLDPLMNYSCAYWANADDLAAAQAAKLELICRKLALEPGMRVLDIGCGWGGFARYAATRHCVTVTGVTLSKQQADYAREACRELPVDIQLRDYRDVNERFDRLVSIGMFEHVGQRNYATYMHTALRCLEPDGLFLLHTIGQTPTTRSNDPWLDKYIFPNGEIPSVRQISEAMEPCFTLEDWHNFGPDYDRTLMAWKGNFEAAWPQLKERYDERFRRMWSFYLMFCAGLFRARRLQLWQLVLSPRRSGRHYRSVR